MSITEDQTVVITFLDAPSTHGGAAVVRIETHISIVFLAGSRAWKLKRAVHFDYVDASTVDRRRRLCEKEVQLNRRTAPGLYTGVVAITRETTGSLALGGSGAPVDWVVEMRRFDQEALFDRLAQRGRLDVEMMPPLAAAVAAFHLTAEQRRDHGGAAGMRWVVDGNAAGFAEFGAGLFDPAAAEGVTRKTALALDRHGSVLEARREAGFVRQCHGDLHLRNIVLLEGRPTLFDGVEFNDEIACVDVLYDLAFLLMDLWRRRLPAHANAVWNQYLTETGELNDLGLMPFFLSCRAAIRAKTSATALRMQGHTANWVELAATARDYLAIAEQFLQPPPPCLVAIGGLSGAGKSTVARALAPIVGAVPGAIVLRSDEIRKQVCGIPLLTRLGPEGYTTEITHRVYAELLERGGAVLNGGFGAVVDATFLQAADRDAIESLAQAAGVPFVGLWLEAPEQTLLERLRQREPDASDADAAVLHMQRAWDAGTVSWRRLDGSRPINAVLTDTLASLGTHANDARTTLTRSSRT